MIYTLPCPDCGGAMVALTRQKERCSRCQRARDYKPSARVVHDGGPIRACSADCPKCAEERNDVAARLARDPRAGLGALIRPKVQTHCLRGHALTPDNSYMSHGRRTCRTCQVARVRVRNASRRGAVTEV